MLGLKTELENNQFIAAHENAYKEFFIISETPVRGRKIKYNNEAIQKQRNRYAGFFAILSNDIKDPIQTLRVYRNKDVVEKSFDDLKNQLDMKRLRVHNSAAMDGRLFIQFIALIYMSAIRRDMRKAELTYQFTVRKLVQEMETIARIDYSGKYGHLITETTKKQRLVLEKMGVQVKL